MRYEDLIGRNAPRWPYSVNYGKETQIGCDVLILGAGSAGITAAIAAAREGGKVVVVDKGHAQTSGQAGPGVEHYQACPGNPSSKYTPDEYMEILLKSPNGSLNSIPRYIKCRESWDNLLEIEKAGMKIRDTDDVFKGAPFRDEKTKLCFAYNYQHKDIIRIWGSTFKKVMYEKAKRLGVTFYHRTFATSLLTEGGKQGAAVVGATALDTHTGEFYIFNAKATVMTMACQMRTHVFDSERAGLRNNNLFPPSMTGDGHAMAYRAGALMASTDILSGGGTGGAPGGLTWPQYAYGNSENTYYAASITDAVGNEVAWKRQDGTVLPKGPDGVDARSIPLPGQLSTVQTHAGGTIARPDLDNPKYIRPFYTDFSIMPWYERLAIFSMMVPHEGRGLIPVYHNFLQHGFDPEKDMLQHYPGGFSGEGGIRPANWLAPRGGGVHVDWNGMSTLPRMFAAGYQVHGGGNFAMASTNGRYAGRHAARFAKGATLPGIERKQVEVEKARVYFPLLPKRGGGMDWKEFNAGVCKVNNFYCVDRNTELLKIGLKWMDEILENEALDVHARHPRELMRVLEIFNIITCSQMIMESVKAPRVEPKHWRTIKQDGGDVKLGKMPWDYAGGSLAEIKAAYNAHNE